jgi:lipoprotein NlpD
MVVPGDTLYSIARHQGVDLAHLMRWNNISDSRHLVVGQVLRLSSAPADSVTVTGHSMATLPTLPMPGDKAKNEPIFLPPLAEKTSTSVAPQAIAKEPSAARTAAAKNLNWHWPARGRIIQPFNNHTKGIDIAGYSGEPVTAAADGKVMYSGNGVRGLGNLIIINHRSGFITAYAHNRKLLVKTGQEIKRGTQIAELGDSDTISPPRLHFEIRLQGTPVDPLQYLPPVPSQ